MLLAIQRGTKVDYAQYKQLKDEIEIDHKKKLEALEMVWRMCQKQNGSSASSVEHFGSTTSDAVRRVVEGLANDFTANDIVQGLKDHSVKGVQRIAITNTIHRLCRRGELEVVKKGRGRMAGVYRKKKQEMSKT